MANGLYTTLHDWQNEYTAHLSADLGSSDTDVFLDTVPTPTEGCLVIDPDTPASTEIIFYTSKTSSKVTVPSVANGRGYDSTSATTHTSGTKVIMAPIADDFRYIRTVATTTPQGWTSVAAAPNTVTALGNRSYSLVFNGADYTSTLSAGMRLRTTRTVAAPTQCTSLNGSTQFYSKTSPNGMTFTNNFVVSAWVKLAAYGTQVTIASRYNGTSGWDFNIGSDGRLNITGYNAGAANFKNLSSYQSVSLNKWVHLTAKLDMSSATNSPTVNYMMFDGVDVPAIQSSGGTAPTALIQAGNLEIGSRNGGLLPFNGKLAQVAIYSAQVAQATILASMHQGLAGTETSLISAYSFNNSINDLNANANNLTANGSAVATNADSPFGGQADGTISSTLDYAIITKTAFSTNTTLTVQVPEGCTIPTSGGVSATSYSTQKTPWQFPGQRGKWQIVTLLGTNLTQANPGTGSWVQITGAILNLPTGEWYEAGWKGVVQFSYGAGAGGDSYFGMGSTSTPDGELTIRNQAPGTASLSSSSLPASPTKPLSLAAATAYNMYAYAVAGTGGSGFLLLGAPATAAQGPIFKMFAELAYL